MKPPEDAPLPWKQGQTWEKVIYADDSKRLGEFRNPRHAAYAVAAANALPGLMEMASKLIAWDEASFCPQMGAGSLDEVCVLARAALAALPEGVRAP